MRRSNICKLLFLHCQSKRISYQNKTFGGDRLHVPIFDVSRPTDQCKGKKITHQKDLVLHNKYYQIKMNFISQFYNKKKLRPGKSSAHVADVCAARSSRIVTTKIYSDQPEFSQRDILQFENTPDISQHLKAFMGLVKARFFASVLSC